MTPKASLSERIKELLECTEMDDHDLPPCEKCERITKAIMKAIEIGMPEEIGINGHIYNALKYSEDYMKGWNDCLKEMLAYECKCFCHTQGFAGDISKHKCC